MIVTQPDARRIIAAHYDDMPFKLTAKTQLGVRPVFDPRPTLAWCKLDTGRDSAVRIGQLLQAGGIDWDWSI